VGGRAGLEEALDPAGGGGPSHSAQHLGMAQHRPRLSGHLSTSGSDIKAAIQTGKQKINVGYERRSAVASGINAKSSKDGPTHSPTHNRRFLRFLPATKAAPGVCKSLKSQVQRHF
jgi:hypothetical protein